MAHKGRKQANKADPEIPVKLPSRDELKAFIKRSGGRAGKREIAKEFGLGTEHRPRIRMMLKELAGAGELKPAGRQRYTDPSHLPEVMVVQVTGTDKNGDPIARPMGLEPGKPVPGVFMLPEASGQPALAPGQRVLARLKSVGPDKYEGRTIKRLAESVARVLGIFRAPNRLVPTDRRAKAEWTIPAGEALEAEDGNIVLAEPLPGRAYGLKPARITQVLGKMGDAKSVSLICLYTHDIPQVFAPETLKEAVKAKAVALGKRTDLRETPLITIDGEDARDFDDAVYAEPDGEGFRLIVAIADVAHYVRPDSSLNRDARERGNSVYFPDRVVPMLPEELSNGWCSLRPDEDRGCLFVEMWVDKEGRKTRHKFGRGLMRSAARLTYELVEAAQ